MLLSTGNTLFKATCNLFEYRILDLGITPKVIGDILIARDVGACTTSIVTSGIAFFLVAQIRNLDRLVALSN